MCGIWSQNSYRRQNAAGIEKFNKELYRDGEGRGSENIIRGWSWCIFCCYHKIPETG